MSSTSWVGTGEKRRTPPPHSPPAGYMKAGRKENVGTSWNRNRRQNKGKTQKPGRGTSEDRFSWLLPANDKSKSWRKNKSFSGRVHERGSGPGCCHSNVLYGKSPDLSIHLGQHVPWTAYWRGHQAVGGEGSLSAHNAYLTLQCQLPSSASPNRGDEPSLIQTNLLEG